MTIDVAAKPVGSHPGDLELRAPGVSARGGGQHSQRGRVLSGKGSASGSSSASLAWSSPRTTSSSTWRRWWGSFIA